MKPIAFVAVALAVLASSCSSSDDAKPATGPACAASYPGTYALTYKRTTTPEAGTPCESIKARYDATLTIGTKAATWTEVDADDGSETVYTVNPKALLDTPPRCVIVATHSEKSADGSTLTAAALIERDDAGNLTGSNTFAVHDANDAIVCKVDFDASATPQ
jgi:hypothetical protein